MTTVPFILGVKQYTVRRYTAVHKPRFGSRYGEDWKRYDNGSHPFLFERNILLQLKSHPFCLQISLLQTAVHNRNSGISGCKRYSKHQSGTVMQSVLRGQYPECI